MNKFKKMFSISLVIMMLFTMIPLGSSVIAEPEASEATSNLYEPWKHGYRYVDILNWDANSDPYAEELRAKVPLQERNETFAATQANPNLIPDTMLYNTAGGNYRSTDVTESPWNGNMHYEEFAYHTYKFWQYTDLIGAGGRPTSGTERGATEKEYGIVGIPIPAFINAAHKNGVKAIAEYFIPRDPMYTEEFLYKDENGEFPYAKKMIEIQRYYGFDGYFINQEGAFDVKKVPLMKEMLAWMVSEGCYIQWYDSVISRTGGISYRNEFIDEGNNKNSDWVKDDVFGKVSDSFWLNYWWTQQRIDNSVAAALRQGLNPHQTLFLGIESGMGKFVGADATSNSGHTNKHLDWILDDTENPVMSIALWGADFTHETYLKNPPTNDRYQSKYHWAAEERERMWFTSPKQNPTDFSTDIDRSDVLIDPSDNAANESKTNEINWKGISRYIAERSVINGSAFVSNFNNGHGMQYFKDGKVSRDVEWANMNVQDILPTWQWWVEGENSENLDLDWDYGTKLKKTMMDGTESSFDYNQLGAYEGGSSLAIFGDLKGSNFVNLYKTDLNVNTNSKISVTYSKSSDNDSSTMKLGIIFKDNPSEKVYLSIENSGNKTDGWKTAEFSLSNYAGRDIAALGVELNSSDTISNYQLNLGQIKISDGAKTVDAPENVEIKYEFDETDELQLSWTLGSYNTVKNYSVYANYQDESTKYVGGGYDDIYYIKTLENRENVVSLSVKAVSVDGTESAATSIPFSDQKSVSNVKTESKNGKLYIKWDELGTDFSSVKVELDYWYSDKTETYTKTVNRGAKNAELGIPLEDGSKYVLTLTAINADSSEKSSINYFGTLLDNFSEPFNGDIRVNTVDDSAYPNTFNITPPLSIDWGRLFVTINGETSVHRRGGVITMRRIALPDGYVDISVVVEDKNGNRSAPTQYEFINRVPISKPDTEYVMHPYSGVVYLDNQMTLSIKNNAGLLDPTLFNWTLNGTYDAGTTIDVNGILSVSSIETESVINVSATKKDNAFVVSGVFAVESARELSITDFPDPALYAWVVSNVGNGTNVTNAQVKNFNDQIDLTGLDISDFTGLNLFSNVTKLNISENTKITSLNTNFFPPKLETLIMKNCINLASIRNSAFRDMVNLNSINITGCTNLEYLNISGVSVDELLYGNSSDFSKLSFIDITNTNLNVSENKVVWELVKSVQDRMKGKTTTIPVYENLALNKSIVDTNFPESSLYAINDGNISKWEHSDRKNTELDPGYIVFDMGEETEVDAIEFHASNYNYQPKDFTLSASSNGTTFTEILSVTGNTVANFSSDVTPSKGRYFKINITANYSASRAVQIAEIMLHGNKFVETSHTARFNSDQPSFAKLNGLISTLATYKSSDYLLDSWNALQIALTAAKTVANNPYALQSEINTALTALDDAKNNLINISVLKSLISAADDMIANGDLTSTVEAVVTEFNAALKEAKGLIVSSSTTQGDVNTSSLRLIQAIGMAGWKQGNKDSLQIAVDLAEIIKGKLNLYFDTGKTEFLTALEKAHVVLLDGNAMQDDVDAARDKLIETMTKLKLKPDKTKLKELIDKSNALNLDLYTEDSVSVLLKALTSGVVVYDNEVATENDVDTAVTLLADALDKLVLKGTGSSSSSSTGTGSSSSSFTDTGSSSSSSTDTGSSSSSSTDTGSTNASSGTVTTTGSKKPTTPQTGESVVPMILFVLMFTFSGMILFLQKKRQK